MHAQRKQHKQRKSSARKRAKEDNRKKISALRDNVETIKRDLLDTHAYTIEQMPKMISLLENLTSLANGSMDKALFDFEGFIALWISFRTTTSVAGWLSAIHLFFRATHSQSVTLKIVKIITNAISSGLDCQGEGIPELEEKFDHFKKLLDNWKQYKESDLAKNMANAMNIAVTLGFFPDLAEADFKIGDYSVIKTKVWDIQKDCVSFVEMGLKTLFFFIERGYAAWKFNDLNMLLYSEDKFRAMDEEYALLMSAMPLLETGKLAELKNYNKCIEDEFDFDRRVNKLYVGFVHMLKTEKHPQTRMILNNKILLLSKLRTQLIMAQKQSCIREKPYGILIHGGSGVGKTAVNGILLKILSKANGFSSSKESMVTLNEADKYMSEYNACHTAVTLDDFCNMKPEFYDGSPCEQIITFLNNVPKAAIKAEAELKGNVMIQPKFVTVTTNVKHLHAGKFSSEPASILRRFEIILDVKLRPEWVDRQTQVFNKNMVKPGQFIPDAWHIDIQYVSIIRNAGDTTDTYEFVNIQENASIFDVIEYLKKDSLKHFASQVSFVSSMESMYSMETCEHFYPINECRLCQACKTPLDQQMLFDPLGGFEDSDPRVVQQVRDSIAHKPKVGTKLAGIVADWYVERKLQQSYSLVQTKFNNLVDAFVDKKNWVLIGLFGGSLAVGAYYAFKYYMEIQDQGSVVQTPVLFEDDIENPWKKVQSVDIPITMKAASTTWRDLATKVEKSCAYVEMIDTKRIATQGCMIMPISNNFWLMPGHMVDDDKEYTIKVQTTEKGVLGKNPTQIIGKDLWYRIPKTDFVLVCLTSGGDVPDFTQFFPRDLNNIDGLMVHSCLKSREGVLSSYDFKLGRQKRIDAKCGSYNGIDYYFPENTRTGMCMMPIIPRKTGATILGFHLAGRTGTTYGAAGLLTLSMLEDAKAQLRSQKVLMSHSAGTMCTEKYGIDFKVTTAAHEKSPVHFLSEEDGVQPIGQVYGGHAIGTRHFRSDVCQSPISPLVTSIMDLPNKHGKPRGMNSWIHWQRDLDKMSQPRGMFRPQLMIKAREDLKAMVSGILDEQPHLEKLIHPYSMDAVLAGVDGVNSVDRVDLSTSMGWPINKQKKNYIQESDRKVKGIACPLDMDDMFHDEINRMEECLIAGERVYTIFRGNLKDEPTKVTKDKVRVFAGCEFAFSCLVRKYYLSVIRVLQKNWIKFECAVGVVAQSPDWTLLAEHLTKYGSKRMIAGDYSAFDKNASPDIMMASFDILISIAERSGYSQEQLTVMRGIATEICYPVYEYNGVYINILGSNPSGHPLTVIVNNFSNCLYMRYAYYVLHEHEENVPLFHEVIALMCYGDDNAMGVSEKETKFNHTAVAGILNDVGIKYTMADKESESVPFIPFDEVNFLKRGFRYDTELKNWIAPIEEMSIQKSLHNFMNRKGSPVLPEAIAADALMNANAEYWRHGKEIFNLRHPQLQQVAAEADLLMYTGNLPDHEEMVQRYFGVKTRKDILDEPTTARFE